MISRSRVVDLSDMEQKIGDLGVGFVDAEIVVEAVRTVINCDVLGQTFKIGFSVQKKLFDPEELDQLVNGCRITPGQKRVLMERAPLIARTLNEKIKTATGLKTERVAAKIAHIPSPSDSLTIVKSVAYELLIEPDVGTKKK